MTQATPLTERQLFLAERRSGVGGSDVHHLWSLEPYGCRLRLWREKRGEEPDRPEEDLDVFRRGRKLEALIADEYSERTGHRVETRGHARHPQFPHLVVHIDRAVFSPHREGFGVLECKSVGRNLYYSYLREGLPDSHILQLQHGMLVTGATWGAFALLWPDGWKLHPWEVERDEDLCEDIRDEADIFWAEVQNGPMPPRLDVTDDRCHSCPFQIKCQGEVIERLMTEGKGAVKDPSLAGLVREWARTKEAVDAADAEHEGVKAELRLKVGDSRTIVDTPAGKIHYAPQQEWNVVKLEAEKPEVMKQYRTKYDLGKLSAEHPELEKDYRKAGKKRPLRVYPR
jgi:putative phage-type endonuclease